METWGLWGFAAAAVLAMILAWIAEQWQHRRRILRVPTRVHVNGIRGKSTITRYVAAALRAADLKVIAKTTGSATRLILHDGSELPVRRIGAPTILEQISLLRRALCPDTDAMVIECMALAPDYQKVSERRMICATHGIIANVRHDHLEQLGHSLEEIAESLASTAPQNGTLYTAVQDPDLLKILRAHATGPVVAVTPDDISDAEMDRFGPLDVAENIALALAVARDHGIDRAVALRAMAEAGEDPGASAFKVIETRDGTLHWLNLFSVNDVDSVQTVLDQSLRQLPDLPVVLVLNTRSDRTDRTAEFVRWIAEQRPDTRVVEMGDAADLAAKRLRSRGARESGMMHIDRSDKRDDVVRRLLRVAGGRDAIAVGLANIHTDDAERLGDRLEDG